MDVEQHFIIGTAGHIDHGKTELVKALTGIDTDRLKEEKERGMTIDLGYAYLDVDGVRVGIVDVPGHERFVKNMLAGVTGIDMAMLVVAADDGVMPQTVEHLEILDLLGVERGIVVITKIDLADDELLSLVREDVEKLLKGTSLEGAEILTASSVTGEGIEDVKRKIAEMVKGGRTERDVELPFRMPIDRVFNLPGRGCIATGSMAAGRIKVGDEADIVPAGVRGRIRSMQVHGRDVKEAYAGQRVAVNLAGVKASQIARGDVLVEPGHVKPTHLVDVFVRYLPGAIRPLRHNDRVRFHTGTSEAIGRVSILGCEEIKPGETGYMQVKLERPVAVQPHDRFIIRSYSPVRTIGGGEVVRSRTRRLKRFRAGVVRMLERMRAGGAEAVQQALMESVPFSLRSEQLVHLLEMPLSRVGEIIEGLKQEGTILEVRGGLLAHKLQVEKLERKVEQALESFHRSNRLRVGMLPRALLERVHSPIPPDAFAFVIERMKQAGRLREVNGRLALCDFEPVLNDREKEIMKRLEEVFREAGFATPSARQAADMFPGEQHIVEKLLTLLTEMGRIVIVGEGVYLHAETVERLKRLVVDALTERGRMTVADFRDVLGTSRKYLIPILEYLDATGVTIRKGDYRVLKK